METKETSKPNYVVSPLTARFLDILKRYEDLENEMYALVQESRGSVFTDTDMDFFVECSEDLREEVGRLMSVRIMDQLSEREPGNDSVVEM